MSGAKTMPIFKMVAQPGRMAMAMEPGVCAKMELSQDYALLEDGKIVVAMHTKSNATLQSEPTEATVKLLPRLTGILRQNAQKERSWSAELLQVPITMFGGGIVTGPQLSTAAKRKQNQS